MIVRINSCWIKAVLTLSFGILLSGCATTSVFSPYPKQMKPIRQSLNSSGYQSAIKTLSAKLDSNDKDLYAMELGRVQQLSGDYQDSITTFNMVINDVQQQMLAAKIRASKVLAQTGSLMTNDNALPYQVKSYELIFLYNYQVLNYLAIGDIQDALVSVRQSDQQQQWFVAAHQYQLQQAQQLADQHKWNLDPFSYGPTKETYNLASQVSDPMQNGFAYFLSGILYEATGDYDDAFISLQNALKVAPNNTYVRNTLLEVLQERGGGVQLQYYMKQFGLSTAPRIPAGSGQIVVIYEQGLVPALQPSSFPINLDNVSQLFTFPIYKEPKKPIPSLSVSQQQNNTISTLGQTQQLVNVQALAAKELVQNYPIIFIREALRLITQYAVLTSPEDNKNSTTGGKIVNSIAASIYMDIMAGADLRSWLTLPHTVQVYQTYLPAAQISLILDQDGIKQTVPLSVRADHTTIVWVVGVDKNLQVKLINL